jgi:hypothetical protein
MSPGLSPSAEGTVYSNNARSSLSVLELCTSIKESIHDFSIGELIYWMQTSTLSPIGIGFVGVAFVVAFVGIETNTHGSDVSWICCGAYHVVLC